MSWCLHLGMWAEYVTGRPQQHWCHDASILTCQLSMLMVCHSNIDVMTSWLVREYVTGRPQQHWCHDACVLACELSMLTVGYSNTGVMTPASWFVSWVCYWWATATLMSWHLHLGLWAEYVTGRPQQHGCHDACILACELSMLLVGHSKIDVMTPSSWLVIWVC